MGFGRRRRITPRVNIVPMIDVVLQLLLFFVLTTTFNPGAEAMKVDLPETLARGGAPDGIVIVVDRGGGIAYRDRPVTIRELRRLLREEAPHSPGSVAVIKADKEARHGRVVEVMDAVRAAGMSRMAIGTEPGEPSPGDEGQSFPPSP